ncbi:hypothetical protein [Rhodoblastus acidophilus]|uniref:hypothetical protein n=1 Tax=Rhodoblastus acidophilus TaxID=1074 RepID=UPI002226862E|nr:hypothetical protein [Rhodoblastus acidophilus]
MIPFPRFVADRAKTVATTEVIYALVHMKIAIFQLIALGLFRCARDLKSLGRKAVPVRTRPPAPNAKG